jgi:phytoene dehydrogenase-like protein
MITAIFCDECKYEFSLNPVNIKEVTINLGGQALTLVYFACPKCNKIYRITLKDERYEELKEDLERTKMRIRKNRGSRNDELARLLNSMVIRKHERIRNHLTQLNNKFPGTFTFVASENNHKDKIITYLP